MVTSSSIVCVSSTSQRKLPTFIHYTASRCDSLVMPAIRMHTKVTKNIFQNDHVNKRTKTHLGNTLTCFREIHKYAENLSKWSVSPQALAHH